MNDVFAGLVSRLKPRPSDVVGIDIGASGVKVVRLRASRGGGVAVAAADILPPMEMATVAGATRPLLLPQELQAWSAAVAYSFPKATVKLLRLPADKIESAKYPDLLGLQLSSEYRFGHLAQPDGGGGEVPVVAIGAQNDAVEWIKALLPHGRPCLGSVEISGLAALTAGQRQMSDGEPRCELAIDVGKSVTTMWLGFQGRPLVLRQFAVGADTVAAHVMGELGVDAETAGDILNVGAVNVRASVHQALEGFLRQVGIAIDFAERRAGQRLGRVWLSGGMAASRDLAEELQEQAGMAPIVLNPWKDMTVLPGALTERAQGCECRFAAATGAALGLMEEA